jgi:hypothetical protein
MADPLGQIPPTAARAALPAAASPLLVELAQAPSAAVLQATLLSATVIGRDGNGALLLQTDQGALTLKTALPLPVGAQVDLRLVAGPPQAALLLNVAEPPTRSAPPATSATVAAELPTDPVDLGTQLTATVSASANDSAGAAVLAAGSRLILRVVPLTEALPGAAAFTGTVVAAPVSASTVAAGKTAIAAAAADNTTIIANAVTAIAVEDVAIGSATTGAASGTTIAANAAADAVTAGTVTVVAGTIADAVAAGTADATLLQTPLGLLTLDRRLAVPPGTTLGLEQLATLPPDVPDASEPPGRAWPTLAEALTAFDRIAPDLAARLRSDLTPQSGAQLAGTLLFLMGALGSDSWPGAKAGSVLDRAGRSDLRARLDGDIAELHRLADPPSGDWHVFVLPLINGPALQAVRLYLRRNSGGNTRPEDGTRFVLDVEMSRLGALQLDGLVRHKYLDLMLRSQIEIAPELRQEITTVFRNTTTAAGFVGDIAFATTARFSVAPLDALRPPIGIDA